MSMNRFNSLAAGLAVGMVVVATPATATVEVQAAAKPDAEWKSFPTRTLEDLPAAVRTNLDSQLSRYDGLIAGKAKATGFFHTEKIRGRWWLIDPDGCLFIHKGVASVNTTASPGATAAFDAKFGSQTNWAAQTTALLRENGFNGAGAWSDDTALRTAEHPLVYTRIWNFMAAYGRERGGTFARPGHTGYPGDCIFVFDPAFEKFCDEFAKPLAAMKDDAWLLGHFSDNEMPLSRAALRNYLQLPAADSGHQAAQTWLQSRHGKNATTNNITERDEQDFLGVVTARYFEIVSRAIKKYDPNHLYLGARFYGSNIHCPEMFKAAGPFVDVVSVNLYGAWTPNPERLEMWTREYGKPFLITEWYAKAVDSGLANTGGAGWVVKTQRDRGLFYQNFTFALLESKGCVGWHWFKYMDNDPAAKKTDASNQDSNKGILNNRYEPYPPLLEAMKEINQRAYGLIKYFDSAGKANVVEARKIR